MALQKNKMGTGEEEDEERQQYFFCSANMTKYNTQDTHDTNNTSRIVCTANQKTSNASGSTIKHRHATRAMTHINDFQCDN